jgi:hypothetical protein
MDHSVKLKLGQVESRSVKTGRRAQNAVYHRFNSTSTVNASPRMLLEGLETSE